MTDVQKFLDARNPKWIYVAMSVPYFEGVVTRCLPATPEWKRRIERLINRAKRAGMKSTKMTPGYNAVKLDRGGPYASLLVILQEGQWG